MSLTAVFVVILAFGAWYVVDRGENGHSLFTTADDVLRDADLSARTILVTGCRQGGIGFETARALAAAGATVLVHARKLPQAEAACDAIRLAHAAAEVRAVAADLSDLRDVKQLTDALVARGEPLHGLVANAGIAWLEERRATTQGFEMVMGVNHLAHAFMAFELLPLLKLAGTAERPARVALTSSLAHAQASAAFIDTPLMDHSQVAGAAYSVTQAYADSKAANALFARKFDSEFRGANIRAFSGHPGMIVTNILQHAEKGKTWFSWIMTVGGKIIRPFVKNMAQGASTNVYMVAADEALQHGGAYFENAHVSRLTGGGKQMADNAAIVDKFWSKTKQLLQQQ